RQDSFRPAYGRTVQTFPRQCIFIATTNSTEFLQDATGNRRFLPLTISNVRVRDNEKLIKFLDDDKYIDSLWAEAYYKYMNGAQPQLSNEAQKYIDDTVDEFKVRDADVGLMEQYIDTKLPDN